MAVCPNCKKEITTLINHVYGSLIAFEFDGENYEFADCSGGDYEEFCCPVCGFVIATTEEQAKEFLKRSN